MESLVIKLNGLKKIGMQSENEKKKKASEDIVRIEKQLDGLFTSNPSEIFSEEDKAKLLDLEGCKIFYLNKKKLLGV